MSKLTIKLVPPQKKSTKKKNQERKSKGLVSQQPMPFITLEELIKQLTDEYVQKQRTPVMLDEFMSEGWRTRIPRNDDDDEDHSPIIIEGELMQSQTQIMIRNPPILPKRKRTFASLFNQNTCSLCFLLFLSVQSTINNQLFQEPYQGGVSP